MTHLKLVWTPYLQFFWHPGHHSLSCTVNLAEGDSSYVTLAKNILFSLVCKVKYRLTAWCSGIPVIWPKLVFRSPPLVLSSPATGIYSPCLCRALCFHLLVFAPAVCSPGNVLPSSAF